MRSYSELKELNWGHSERLKGYMLHDLYKRGLPDDAEETIARQKDVEMLVSDKDGYSMGTSFKPPLPEDSKERRLTLANRQEIFKTYQWACSLWAEHPQHKALKESFEALSAGLGSTEINKLVCIGLGSLSPPPYHTLQELRGAHEEAQKRKKDDYFGWYYLRPYFQHLAAQTVSQLLKRQNDGKPLELYAQDIGYREDDIQVLENDVGKLGNNHGNGKANFTVLDGSPNSHEGLSQDRPRDLRLHCTADDAPEANDLRN